MGQEELQKESRVNTRSVPREPRKHYVIIYNDDYTTFDFVIMLMITVFHKSHDEACQIAEDTHIHQKAIVGSYSLDIAKSRVSKATAMAREEGFPLKFDIQAE